MAGAYVFRPGLIPSVVTLVLLAILVNLGFWQLDRAEQKQALLDQYAGQSKQGVVRIDGAMTHASKDLDYQPAQVRGSYDPVHQFLLDNRTHQGRAGYQVLTPLRIHGSDHAILVNRGWVPQGATRADLPALPVAEGRVDVVGLLKHPPSKVFVLGEGEDQALGWPKVLQQIRLDLHAEQLGYPLLPMMLLQDPDADHGFVRDWQPVTFGPEKNVGYAVQWFSLAAALMLIYLFVNVKKQRHEQ